MKHDERVNDRADSSWSLPFLLLDWCYIVFRDALFCFSLFTALSLLICMSTIYPRLSLLYALHTHTSLLIIFLPIDAAPLSNAHKAAPCAYPQNHAPSPQ